jgi:hypothetical protein
VGTTVFGNDDGKSVGAIVGKSDGDDDGCLVDSVGIKLGKSVGILNVGPPVEGETLG